MFKSSKIQSNINKLYVTVLLIFMYPSDRLKVGVKFFFFASELVPHLSNQCAALAVDPNASRVKQVTPVRAVCDFGIYLDCDLSMRTHV